MNIYSYTFNNPINLTDPLGDSVRDFLDPIVDFLEEFNILKPLLDDLDKANKLRAQAACENLDPEDDRVEYYIYAERALLQRAIGDALKATAESFMLEASAGTDLPLVSVVDSAYTLMDSESSGSEKALAVVGLGLTGLGAVSDFREYVHGAENLPKSTGWSSSVSEFTSNGVYVISRE